MALVRRERILILAKTCPSPSAAKHVETSYVAGINKDGVMRRLTPSSDTQVGTGPFLNLFGLDSPPLAA
jgi:hypothetical protein